MQASWNSVRPSDDTLPRDLNYRGQGCVLWDHSDGPEVIHMSEKSTFVLVAAKPADFFKTMGWA